MSKVDLQNLKAAMVLGLNSTPANVTVNWWDGVVKDERGEAVIVLMVPVDPATNYTAMAKKVLSGYKIKAEVIEGSSYNLLPIGVDYLENCMTPRPTRTWVPDMDEGHNEWKKKVTDELDMRGITSLKMDFSGAGDSGNDDEWHCHRSGGPDDSWYPKDWNSDSGKHWRAQNEHELPQEVYDLISSYVWETLIQVDVVNNDGGGGDLTIDLSEDEPEFLFSVYTNEMVTHDHEVDTPV